MLFGTCVTAVLFALLAVTGSAAAQVAGELRGRVTDAATAQAIANGRVEVSGRPQFVRTDADGAYVVRGLEPGAYAVTVRALGYLVRTAEARVSNGRATVLDVELHGLRLVLHDVVVRAARDSGALNATVLDRTEIEQSGHRDLGELLATVPGVVMTAAGGPGQPSRVSIRGSSAGQVLVLVDGVPLNSALTGDADLSRITLESVDRVVVRVGAGSARYGARAMAGVIEVETRKPTHELSTLLRAGALGERDVSLAFGTSTRASTIDATPVPGLDAGAALVADYRTVQGDFAYAVPTFRGGGRTRRINSDATSTAVQGGVTLDGAFGTARVQGTWQHTDRGLAGTIVQPSLTGRQSNARAGVAANAQGVAGTVAWTATVDATHERGTFTDPAPPFSAAFHDTIDASALTASSTGALQLGDVALSAGGELRSLDVTSTALAPDAPHWQRSLGTWGDVRLRRPLAWDVILDAALSARVDATSLPGARAFSPRAAVSATRGALATSLSMGSGYAPPTLSDQFFHEGVQTRANPALRPERTRRDIEARFTLRETAVGPATFQGEAAAYRANIDGMILWLPDFRFIWSPTNYDVHRAGWELSAQGRVPNAHVEVRSTFNRSNVTYAGGLATGQVAYRPRTTANVVIAYAPRAWRVDITNRYVGWRRTAAGLALNSLEPYWMTDATVSTVLEQRGWSFTSAAGVENALNTTAAMLVDYPFPTRTWTLSLRVRRTTSHSP